MDIAIHINPTQTHQFEHAEWFRCGFKKHGINPAITSDINKKADIHIVSGPHYAKQYWTGHPRVILIDRALYHDDKSGRWASMDYVSIGWMKENGEREYKIGSKSKHQPVKIKTRGSGAGTIFLADYNGPIHQADTIRLHPDNGTTKERLIDAIRRHDTAIGYRTTALITAAIEGLNIICMDENHILNDPKWPEILPWADWHYSQIESGEAWEHLKS